MFPEETHVKIVKKLDALEADAYRVYRSMESLRIELQEQWHVLPSGERWTPEKSEATRHSERKG